MDATAIFAIVEDIFNSFPDFAFTAGTMEEQADGSVIISNYFPHGTHTGEPDGLGPFPKMPATGVKVKNDPETCQLFIENGKIVKCVFLTTGDLSGPPGIYTQLGGFPCC